MLNRTTLVFTICNFIFFLCFSEVENDHDIRDHSVQFDIYSDSNPLELALRGCKNEYESCVPLASGAIELQMSVKYGNRLKNWLWNDLCNCSFPPREKQPALQYLHIPKSSTSINWFLHDYFNCSNDNSASNPCSSWLLTPEDQKKGLCEGRLFSCAGHRVDKSLPDVVRYILSTSPVRHSTRY